MKKSRPEHDLIHDALDFPLPQADQRGQDVRGLVDLMEDRRVGIGDDVAEYDGVQLGLGRDLLDRRLRRVQQGDEIQADRTYPGEIETECVMCPVLNYLRSGVVRHPS